MSRISGVAACIATHLLFGITVWHLFWFLKGDLPRESGRSLWIDFALALQFAVPHSILLHPNIRQRLMNYIPAPFYGLMFCSVTCVGLLATILFWQPSANVWCDLQGFPRAAVEFGFFGSWGLLLYSIGLTGFGYQTGWTPWSFWFRRRSVPPRPFQPRSIYLWIRHPVYLSFMGLIWFTPVITSDRAILIGVWTVYVFIGSYLKDQRLLYFLGNRYREYQSKVPGYPGMISGPLARIPYQPKTKIVFNEVKRAA